MKKLIPILLVATSFLSCGNVNKEDITVIDNMQLGVHSDSLTKQFYKNKVLQKVLFTKTYFDNLEEIDNNKLFFQLSELFDFPNYRNQYIHHYGAYLPSVQEGTNNVVGLNILIGHAGNASLFSSEYGLIDVSKETNNQAFNQNVRTDLLDKIEFMLKEKYGEPKEKILEEYTPYFAIEGKTVPNYGTSKSFNGEANVWETKDLKITYFKGIPNYNVFYNTEIDGYTFLFKDNSVEKEINKGDVLCNIYPYISYELKEATIKKMGLDKVNL